MEDADRDRPSDTAWPYSCRGCGQRMRFLTGDGYCAACRRPRLVCGGYESAGGARIKCGRLIQSGMAGEVVGQCVACGALQQVAFATRQRRLARGLDRQREQGYGPAPEGVDPFEGFREER